METEQGDRMRWDMVIWRVSSVTCVPAPPLSKPHAQAAWDQRREAPLMHGQAQGLATHLRTAQTEDIPVTTSQKQV